MLYVPSAGYVVAPAGVDVNQVALPPRRIKWVRWIVGLTGMSITLLVFVLVHTTPMPPITTPHSSPCPR